MTPSPIPPIIAHMFPATRTNRHLQHEKQEHPEGQEPNRIQKLQEIVRQETGDGRLIVRFLVSAMQGGLEGSKPCHRLNAARQLLDLGFTDAQAVIDSSPRPAPRRRIRQAPSPERSLSPALSKIVREETDDGRDAVRFLVEVMQGSLEGFKPHHRLAAARELLHRGFDDTLADDNAGHSDDDAAAPTDPPDDYDYGKCGIYHYDGRGNMLACEAVNCPYVTRGRRSVKPAQSGPGHSHISVADASRSGPDHSRDRAADASQSGPDHSRDRAADASPDGPDHPRDRAAMPERPPARNVPTPGSDTPPESDRRNRLPIFF